MMAEPDRGTVAVDQPSIAVVIPCYQVERTVLEVLEAIGPEVGRIFCVDDCSSDDTADIIQQYAVCDPRIELIRRPVNGGVGAAVLDGYRAAIAARCDVIVKIDGDGQMDPSLVSAFCRPILEGQADYVKGNRFVFLESVRSMPLPRLFGNAGLSFLTKLSTGYWDCFDPTNGYTAIHAQVAARLPLDRIHRRYFFESDILFRLGVIRARVIDLPLQSVYGDEQSNLSIWKCLFTFPGLHVRNLLRRLVYRYFIHDFSIASVNLIVGTLFLLFGVGFGAQHWLRSAQTGQTASAGTVMTAALPIMVGIQLLLNALSHDMTMTPRDALQRRLAYITLHQPRRKKRENRSTINSTQEFPCSLS